MQNVSHGTLESLNAYGNLIERWNSAINLVGSASVPDLWRRHIEDSMQLHSLAPAGWKRWLDLGSGAGLPGIVVAVLERERGRQVILIESDTRKAAFLKTARRILDLDVCILNSRIEDASRQAADIISARALAPLPKLLDLAIVHGTSDCLYIFPKGAHAEKEISEARQRYRFDVEMFDSQTDSEAKILILQNVRNAKH